MKMTDIEFAEPNDSMEQWVQKTCVFQNQLTKKSIIIDVKITPSSLQSELLKLIQTYCPGQNYGISIYNPDQDTFTILKMQAGISQTQIPLEYLQPKVLLIRYKVHHDCYQNGESQKSKDSQRKSAKDRSRQRTIGQSIQLVRQWRHLHLSMNENNKKKISLHQAAKKLGISKKSLDDYYYQLRLGQFYSFDFKNNLDEKIGILRAYVKQFKPQRETKNKKLRHPKRLKIIEFTDQLPNFPEPMLKEISQEQPMQPDLQLLQELARHQFEYKKYDILSSFSQELSFEHNSFNNFLLTQDKGMDNSNKFLTNFQFSLDYQKDPFHELDLSCFKKTLEYGNYDCLFF